jgi:hypothetical protein
MRVIDDLKHEINAEYDIAIGYDDDDTNGFEGYSEEPDFDEMPTDDEISAFINALAQQGVDDAAALPAPVPADDAKREEKAAQTLEEILAIAKAEEALAAAGIEPAPKPADDEDGNANNADDLNPASAADASGSDAAKAIAPKPEDDPKDEVEKTIIIPSNRRSTRKKKKKQLASVLQMLREYEEEDARNVPKIEAQLMLNLDDAMESLIESPKK